LRFSSYLTKRFGFSENFSLTRNFVKVTAGYRFLENPMHGRGHTAEKANCSTGKVPDITDES
jgi:hypothetical protein